MVDKLWEVVGDSLVGNFLMSIIEDDIFVFSDKVRVSLLLLEEVFEVGILERGVVLGKA